LVRKGILNLFSLTRIMPPIPKIPFFKTWVDYSIKKHNKVMPKKPVIKSPTIIR